MIPMLLRLKIRSPEATFGFYLPMLLIYILLLPVYIIAAAAFVLTAAAPGTENARRYILIFLRLPQLLSAARGIEVKVNSNDADVILYLK